MIISHRWKFVYVAAPKTGSTALHAWLSQPAFCETRWSPAMRNQHDTAIPATCRGYHVFTVVRNPFDRLVSLWAHSQSPHSRCVERNPPLTIQEFLTQWAPKATPFYRRTQTAWLAAAERIDQAVDFADLPRIAELVEPLARAKAAAGHIEPLSRKNATQHADWRTLYDEGTAAYVRYWHAEDWAFADWAWPDQGNPNGPTSA